MKGTLTVLVMAALSLVSLPVMGQESAYRIMEKSQLAFYYPGKSVKARITMDLINRNGGRRTRVMSMIRMDLAEGGNQKYFTYFHKPGDVRRITFMVWKYPKRDDDRWIFIPSVDLIRRISASDKRSSFVGSDFTYEDISGRDLKDDTHTLLREETVDGRSCHVVQSIPKKSTEYAKRISWIDKKSFLPIKEEYFDLQGDKYRVFSAKGIKTISGHPTITRGVMKNLKTGHRTEAIMSKIAYDVGVKESDFSERRMRRPPRGWLK